MLIVGFIVVMIYLLTARYKTANLQSMTFNESKLYVIKDWLRKTEAFVSPDS